VTAARLRRFIRQDVVGTSHTAMVATHSFADVGDLCDRVLVLERGRTRAQGPAAEAAAMVGVDGEG
jgi:ABC-type uncharacterized transport system ATPase subunit